MKKTIFAVLLVIFSLGISVFGADTPGMEVFDTENHGIYLTIGGTKVHFPDEVPLYIDENDRTMAAIGCLADFLGYQMDISQSAGAVTLFAGNDTYGFAMDSNKCWKNDSYFDMDTNSVMIHAVPYVPVRYLAEMLGYEISYTTFDRFEDITITKKAGIQGFAPTDSITVWGNIQDRFHEGDGLGSMMSYEGEEPDLKSNNVNEYELKMEMGGSQPPRIFNVYWDTLYDKAFVKAEEILYSIHTDFARFLQSILDNSGDMSHQVGTEERVLFRKYGWTLDYKINTIADSIPEISEIGAFDESQYYYLYNNELSKSVGLDMSLYVGKNVTVDIYHIFESMPAEFYPIQDARGIVVKYQGEIIGAFISAGRHSVESACSLKGESFDTVTGKSFDDYIVPLLKAEEKIVTENPEEIIERYFDAVLKDDYEGMLGCMSKYSAFCGLTTNMLDSKLYNKEIIPMFSRDNIVEFKNLEIETAEYYEWGEDEGSEVFLVKFDTVKADGTEDNSHHWFCLVVYESDKTGWKIEGFGH